MRNLSLFEADRLTLDDAIALSVASLTEYGNRYRHWAIAYSGGKDSTATVAFVAWAIRTGLVASPDSLTVLYADTRMELPPLQQSALRMLAELSAQGFATQVVLPKMEDRFYCYMFGRGVPPPDDYRPQLRQMHRDYGMATDGAVCGGCAHLQRSAYHGATYFKCALFGASRGAGTDWRKSWPACGKFLTTKATS